MDEQLSLQPVQTYTVGELANHYARKNTLKDYQDTLSANTLRRQRDDLAVFAEYLKEAGLLIDADDLYENEASWSAITFGLVKGFKHWLGQQGYAIGSINVRLSTVRSYCKLACDAGYLSTDELLRIQGTHGYTHKGGKHFDEKRAKQGPTRIGKKKAEPIFLTKEQAKALRTQPDTPQGHRDTLLMCLLIDQGLRCGEIAGLKRCNVNVRDGLLIFYRPKVDKEQTHKLRRPTMIALARYLECVDLAPDQPLLVGSRIGGTLQGVMSERAITKRMNYLGKKIGIENLSAHDGRHSWATFAVKGGTNIKNLQEGGAWSSAAMPLRYLASEDIANEGVVLDLDD